MHPITAKLISIHLPEETVIDLKERVMQRVLNELNFHHVKGETRHMYGKYEANVAFRAKYLAKKVSNRAGAGLNRPEVYLDESFCNANHVAGKTWLLDDKNTLRQKTEKENGANL